MTTVIGLMPGERQTGFFGCVPGRAARTAQQVNFSFNSQTDEICHLAHKIGVGARRLPVFSNQTYTFLAKHSDRFYHIGRRNIP